MGGDAREVSTGLASGAKMGGSSKKTAKGRLDKFYHLAKEQGFRSRAAYKLIQLNQKFDFLGSAQCVVDLCAAPGSWLQVAAKNTPVGAVIIGLDLVAIRPIPNVQTFAQDITQYDKCKSIVKGAIKDKFNHMVDVVLNDGAPNVGANWIKDAYTQTELCLYALRLACEILRPNGTFVTKVFRSQDYNSLLWVMNQFFDKVQAHKPSSSRNVSAEIFVVCQGYKAPKKIDPKFFDPTHLFKDVETGPKEDVLTRKKEGKNREGYDPAMGHGLHRSVGVQQFVESEEPTQLLTVYNRIDLEKGDDAFVQVVEEHKGTSEEIKYLCEDLKVLSKSDFKLLLKWRQKLIDATTVKEEEDKDEEEDEEEEDEELKRIRLEEEALAEVGELTADIKARNRRIKKKRNELRSKLQRRIDMKIHGQQEVDLAEAAGQQHGLFDLGTMDADQEGIDAAQAGEYADVSDEEEEQQAIDRTPKDQEDYDEQEDAGIDADYEAYKSRRNIKDKRAEQKANQEMPYLVQVGKDEENEGEPALGTEDFGSDDEDVPRFRGNPLMENFDGPAESGDAKAERFFNSSSLFDGIEAENDDDGGETAAAPAKRHKATASQKLSRDEAAVAEMNAQFENAVGGAGGAGGASGTKVSKKRKWEHDKEEDEEEEMLDAINREDARKAAEFNEKTKLLPKKEQDLAETLAYGELFLRKKERYAVIDASYNRYAFNDDRSTLPDWFKEDEAKHNIPELPITKWQVQRIKDQWKDVDARPIKKVAEAKAKQKVRKIAMMAKLTKQATSALNNSEETREKRESILRKLVSKNAGKTKRSKVSTVVTRKGGKSGNASKKGAKVKVVDKRMKSDSRGQKTALRKAMKANHGRMPKAMQNQAKQLKVNKRKHQSS